MRHVSEALGQTLPGDYRKSLAILLEVEHHFENFEPEDNHRTMTVREALTRWREAPSSWAMSSCASCSPMRISSLL